MARFFGTVQGNKGQATRLGHPKGGLLVEAESYSGDIVVRFRDHRGNDHVTITARAHDGRRSLCLFQGLVTDLLNMDARRAQLALLAGEFLGGQ